MSIFVDRLKEIMPTHHGAKKELAEGIDINQNILTAWLGGRTESYKKYVPQIAAFYGVSSDWLLGLTDEKGQKNNPADISASEAREKSNLIIEGLTPDEANLVRAYAQGVIANRKPQ